MNIDWGLVSVLLVAVSGLSAIAYRAPGAYYAITSTISMAVSALGLCFVMYAVGYSRAFYDLQEIALKGDISTAVNPYSSNWLFLVAAAGFALQGAFRMILYVVNRVRDEEAKK